jgi:hypothetical protein
MSITLGGAGTTTAGQINLTCVGQASAQKLVIQAIRATAFTP